MARSNLQNSRTGANLAQATRLMADGKTARAERILRKLLKSDPGNAEALHLAGVARHRVGKPGQAADLVEKAIRTEPRDARFHRTLGDILHAGGRDERAAECYRAVTALDPGDADTHAALAGALMGLDRIDEALESYRAALRIEPGDITALFGHGNALRAAGRHDEALAAYRAVLALQPHYVPVYSNLGGLLRDMGRLDESFQVLQDSARLKYAPVDLCEDIIQQSAPASDAKLRHDAEQIDYLIGRGVLAADYAAHAQTYRRLADAGAGKRAATDFYRLPLAERRSVAYRQDRALVFNSDLFHETDRIAFREGYENRRINITLLYGRRENA